MKDISSRELHTSLPLSDDSSNEQLPGISELWYHVRTRWVYIAVSLTLGVLLGLFLASSKRQYSSSTTLRIQSGNSSLQITPGQLIAGQGSTDEKIGSELEIMQSRSVLLKVASDLKLQDNADFWGAPIREPLSMGDPHTRDLVDRRMRQIVTFAHLPKTTVVKIKSTTPSPSLSARLSNTLSNEYIAHVFQVRQGSTERVSKWLVEQLNSLEKRVESDQERLVKLQDTLGLLSIDQKTSAYLLADSLSSITKASTEATIERIVAEARYRIISESDPDLIESSQPPLQPNTGGSQGLLETLRKSRAEAAATYSNLTSEFGQNYPDVRQAKARLDELDREVSTEQQRIVNQARISFSAAQSNEAMTSNELKSLKDKAFESRNEMVEFVILQRQYEADRILYEGLMERLQVAGINAGLESAQVDVVDLADIPSIAQKPLPWQWFALSVMVSLAVGVLLAVVAGQLDSRLSRPEEAERLLQIPLLATLEKFPENTSKGHFDELNRTAYAEGLQLLRSSILISRPDHPPKTILVSSTLSGEGKSTVARNLAAIMASHDVRVLLVDADLHKGSQASLAKNARHGLSDTVASSIDPLDLVLPVDAHPGLFLLPAGIKPPQPATLLGSQRMIHVLDTLKENFDLLIIDSPPVLLVTDAILLAPKADAIFLVLRENRASAQEVRKSISLLQRGAQGRIIGFVMNAVFQRRRDYGSYGTHNSPSEVKRV